MDFRPLFNARIGCGGKFQQSKSILELLLPVATLPYPNERARNNNKERAPALLDKLDLAECFCIICVGEAYRPCNHI